MAEALLGDKQQSDAAISGSAILSDVPKRTERAPAPAAAGGGSVLASLAAGAMAGALAKTVIAPLDRTKINFQVSAIPYSWRAAVRWLSAALAREGLPALWRGNSATLARIAPYAAVQFAAHEQWKRVLGVDNMRDAKSHPLRLLLAGALAGVTSQSATYPLDLARARMAVAQTHSTLPQILKALVKDEGARTLYRGYGATVLGVIPYAGVSFFTYETLKRLFTEQTGAAPGGWARIACGGAAGALGQTASYPLDIVRRRMQTARRRTDGGYPCATMADTMRLVYRTEGWRGFFKGLSMNWVKGPVGAGVSFATYDYIRAAFARLA